MDAHARLTPIELRERALEKHRIVEAAAAQKKATKMVAEKIKAAKRCAALRIVPVTEGGSSAKASSGKKAARKKQPAAKDVPSEEAAAAGPSEADAEAADAAAAEEAKLAAAAARAAAEEEREALRERVWAEREQQRRAVMAAIVEEERRLRRLAQQRRDRQLAEKRTQKALHDAAYEGDLPAVRAIVDRWCEECFSDLIGFKLDATDHEGNSALSEAACGGHAAVCSLLLRHGASVNLRSEMGRTPLWRAAFMDRYECASLLLEHGADPRIPSHNLDMPECVAPGAAMRMLLSTWPDELTLEKQAVRDAELAGQWSPPAEEEDEAPCGEPGYSLSITLTKLADALDAVGRDSDRYTLVVDLGGKANTYLSYRDVNMCLAYKPSDADPVTLRKLLLGALRYGKPFVVDFLSMPLTHEALCELLDPVLPGLLELLLSRAIVREEHYASLIRHDDHDEYANLTLWKEQNLAHFHFILLTRLPVPPAWCVDRLFVIKVAGALDDDTAHYH